MSEAEQGELWRQILSSFVGYTIFLIQKLLNINDKKICGKMSIFLK